MQVQPGGQCPDRSSPIDSIHISGCYQGAHRFLTLLRKPQPGEWPGHHSPPCVLAIRQTQVVPFLSSPQVHMCPSLNHVTCTLSFPPICSARQSPKSHPTFLREKTRSPGRWSVPSAPFLCCCRGEAGPRAESGPACPTPPTPSLLRAFSVNCSNKNPHLRLCFEGTQLTKDALLILEKWDWWETWCYHSQWFSKSSPRFTNTEQPGNLWEMQILRLPQTKWIRNSGVGPTICVLASPPGDSDETSLGAYLRREGRAAAVPV